MSGVRKYLDELLKSGCGADACISMGPVDGEHQELAVHSIILSRVPYFAVALSSSFKEGVEKRIVLADVSPKHLEPLIHVLYTDKLPWPEEATDLVDMLSLCRRFDFPASVVQCVLNILGLNAEWGDNILELTTRAYLFDLPDVIEVCLSKVQATFDDVKLEFEEPPGKGQDLSASMLRASANARTAILYRVSRELKDKALPRTHVPVNQYEVLVSTPCRQTVKKELCSPDVTERQLDKLKNTITEERELAAFIAGEMHAAMVLLMSATDQDDKRRSTKAPLPKAEQKSTSRHNKRKQKRR